MGKLTPLSVKNAKPGRHGDGKGLFLLVKDSGAESWLLRVVVAGRRQDIGLGSTDWVTLSEARDKAHDLRKHAKEGRDPIAERDRGKVVVPTFAEAVVKAHLELSKGWADKTAAAFKTSLDTHAVPKIGKHRVDHVGTEQIVAALAPIWTTKPEVAKKVRVRIFQVLQFAKSKGWRTDALPTPKDISGGLAKQPRGGNFAALPFAEIPAYVAGELPKEETAARLALLFTILTAARSGEVRNARWEQIDVESRTWTRSASMMKSAVKHVITLSDAAVAVLERASEVFGKSGLIFPGSRDGSTLSDMTLSKLLRSTGRSETVHGFRSAFRDWAAEKMPTVPAMVAEMALAHAVGNKTEQAYLRSDLRDMRRTLMDAWGRYVAPSLSPGGSDVVELSAPRTAA